MAVSQKQRDTVLQCLEQGLSLRKACIEADISDPIQIRRLVSADESFASQYMRAREAGYEMLSEQLVDSLDDMETDPARLRIQVDTRKWMLAKMLPKIYGDRLDLTAKVTTNTGAGLTDAELMQIAARAKGRGGDVGEGGGGVE